MRRILRRQRSGYALSFLLWLLGIAALLLVFWKTWPSVYTANNPFSAFWESLWNEMLDFIPGVEFRLVYLIVFASAMLVTGVIVFGLSRQWFLVGGEDQTLQCPWCKNYWKTKSHASRPAMVLCPHCRHMVHPVFVDL